MKCTNFTFDTLLAGSLLNENRSNSLNMHAKLLTTIGGYDDEFNEQHSKEDMAAVLAADPDGFLVYSGGDAEATLLSGASLGRDLAKDPELTRFYKELLHPAVRAFEKIEMRGVLLDVPALEKVGEEVKQAIIEATRDAMACIPRSIKARYFRENRLKLSARQMLVDALFTDEGMGLKPEVFAEKERSHRPELWPHGVKLDKHGEPVLDKDGKPIKLAPSTSIKDHLGRFRKHPVAGPFVDALDRLHSAEKTIQTYIGEKNAHGVYEKGFLAHVRPDSRLHPTYILYSGSLYDKGGDDDSGTVTGRLAAKDPAIQTLPKHTRWAKPLRRCYIAPPGYLCWQIDFSQGELRITACRANEPTMLQAYREGKDLHAILAAEANGLAYEELLEWKALGKQDENHPQFLRYKELRQGGKAGNFGFIYGMSAQGMVNYAWKTYGVVMSLDEAEAFRERYFTLYTELEPWHAREKAHARRHGFVRSDLGRIRHLPLIDSPDAYTRSREERRAVNSPIQSALSDLNLWAIVHLEREWGEAEEECCIVGSTHDSIDGYVRADVAQMWMGRYVRTIEAMDIRGTFGWDHQIPFPVDVELGPNRADLAEQDKQELLLAA